MGGGVPQDKRSGVRESAEVLPAPFLYVENEAAGHDVVGVCVRSLIQSPDVIDYEWGSGRRKEEE